jgi:hypothetical protein
MKNLTSWVGLLFLTMAALATPVAIFLVVYDCVGNDAKFTFALWFGLKAWISMLVIGFGVGAPFFIAGK